MTSPFSLDALLAYSDWDRARWRDWFLEKGPGALSVGLGPNTDVARIATDDRGELRVIRRKAETHWFDVLPALIGWVAAQSGEVVEILHT